MRTYRVSRIEHARLLDEAFDRPASFDLAAAWNASTDEFQEGRSTYDATLRVQPRAAEWIRIWQMATVLKTEGPWVTIRVKFHHEDEAAFVALGLGRRAQVLAPQKLKERVREEIEAMAAGLAV
jgi:predicted DNA-binding transcriptional regulator YafY